MLKKKVLAGILVLIAVIGLTSSGYFLGLRDGKKFPENIVVRGVENLQAPSGTANNIDFSVFWQAWQKINEFYLKNKDISNEDKLHGAMRGLVGSLQDPYSEFFAPKENQKFQENVQGNFGGIGAELGVKKNQLVVIAPLKDTPASRAGLLPGDQILKINASSTEGILIENAVSLIRGPEGTAVTLNIFRDGWDKPRDFKIVRANIIVPTLDVSTIDKNITRLELHSFNANADQLFWQAMNVALNNGSKGLVLDLRNNPGGYLEVAVDLAGWFLPKGTLVVSEEGRDSAKREEFKAGGNAALKDFPVVVLINEGSASASEILAGVLRDQRKDIKLVGMTSFGKGTVQQLENLQDGSSLKLTIAHWVLPSGQILDNGGLKPDVEVKMTEDDIAKKRDPQLDKAVEVLKEEISK